MKKFQQTVFLCTSEMMTVKIGIMILTLDSDSYCAISVMPVIVEYRDFKTILIALELKKFTIKP